MGKFSNNNKSDADKFRDNQAQELMLNIGVTTKDRGWIALFVGGKINPTLPKTRQYAFNPKARWNLISKIPKDDEAEKIAKEFLRLASKHDAYW